MRAHGPDGLDELHRCRGGESARSATFFISASSAASNFSRLMLDVRAQYPAMAEIESRCINMIARLLNAPLDKPESEACGVSTVGSSEAIILATLAAKRRWKEKREAAGKSVRNLFLVRSTPRHFSGG